MNEKMERVKKKIDEIKEEREELKEKYDYLVEQMKKTIDKHSQDIGFLKNEARGIADKEVKDEGGISNIRSIINSLEKSIASVEGKQSVLKEKISEDMKSISKDINSRILERLRAVDANIKTRLQDAMNKNVNDIRSLKDDIQKIVKGDEEHEEVFSEIADDINLINKSISELEGKHGVLGTELNERVNLLERETNSEIEKAKGLGERLSKDVEDFEKFASEQRSKMDKFESDVSNKIDMFAMEKENIKRDFSSISNDFKNMGGRLDSLSEKDSDMNQRLQSMELDIENFKKVTEEVLGKLQEDHTIFKENLVAKLNEANDKILSRLSQNELGTYSEIDKQAKEIKLFRAHITQFINDLVSNYEKRFEMMKSEVDQALRLLEERSKEQRAMIFE